MMLTSYRLNPGRYQTAARAAGVHFRTAKRAFLEGWDNPPWARPISEVLEEERVAARAASVEVAQATASARARQIEEREVARLDAAREAGREAQAVRASLSNALSLLANLGQLSQASLAVSRAAAEDMLKEVQAGKLRWRDAMPFLKTLSLVSVRATDQLRESMAAMRLHLGKPEQLVSVLTDGTPTTLVDGKAAVAELGEERMRQALMDIAQGNITPDVRKVIEWQFEKNGGGGVH